MLSLCERPYWTQIWIVQELLLPKTVTIFCGSKELPWCHFEGFFGDIAAIVNSGWGQHKGVSLTIASAASKIVKVKCDWNKQSALPLNDLLHLCRDQRSTDVRDKVYALCGLANDSNRLEIDYGIAPKRLLVAVLEHTCTTLNTSLNTSLKDSKLRKHLVQTGQLLREILKVCFDDQELEALIISRAPQSRFNKDCSNKMSPHDSSPNATNASVSPEYQPTSNHMDLNNMQQASCYSSNIPDPVSYAKSHDIQPLPTLPDVRNLSNPNVKSKRTLPAQSKQMYADLPFGADLKRSISKPTKGSGIDFATHVDTLMRAIQAKQMNSPPEHEQKVCHSTLKFQNQTC
jgi:hypothetical protein